MDQSTIDRTGLVDSHAYAVLDLRKIQDKQLLMLKNPWKHLRWKGRYSEKDKVSWTSQLCKALGYSPTDAQQFDDGIFWIDFESVCQFFDVFYVNWDPSIFPYTYGLHAMWSAGLGPIKDLYSVADNPQYTLEVNSSGSTAVWILLTRHITDKNDFANNKEYITVMVYKSGKKIYLPSDPKPIMDAVRLNSPHYLCQMVISECGCQRYTLVVAQYEKMKTIYYTLRVYSTAEFRLQKVKVPYISKKKETGEWRGKTAGGCGNGISRKTYMNNPIYQLSLDDGSDDNYVLVELKGPKQYNIGFEIEQLSSIRNKPFERRNSGAFRPGYTVLALEAMPAGIYKIQPMTFQQGEEGPFFLTIEASCSFATKRLQ
uniref:Calpain catalytic domain-containing protein n=1 Tax=Setaria digitata TaxID=48799 RepID=A0A915PCF5_9BILA